MTKVNNDSIFMQALAESKVIESLVNKKNLEPNSGEKFNDFIINITSQLRAEPRASISKLFYMEKKTEKEIARSLNLTVNAVENHLQLFRLLLTNSLKSESISESWSFDFLC